MYSSGYSQVSKYSPEAQKKMQYRSKGKSCGYYMRIVFFFSSLIQSLIIVSLVLFLVYGKKQDSASTTRIHDLEESFSRLSIENVALRQQRKNLTNLLNTTLTEKARNDWDLARMRYIANISSFIIEDLDKRLQQCTVDMLIYKNGHISGPCSSPRIIPEGCNCGLHTERLTARLQLVESNFTQTTQRMRTEMDQISKERDNIILEAIRLRRDKATHEKALQFYRIKCKEDFAQSLSGVSNVSRAFLKKIESLFPTHIAFQLTCQNQREHLEQIRTNCTNLSREVEDRFQRYLNTVGEQVSAIQAENSRLKAENWRLNDDYRWCRQNHTGLIQEHKLNFEKLQLKHDKEKERLLMDKMRLNGEIEVLDNNVKYKNKEVEHLTEQIKQLNMSCMFKTGGYPGGTSRTGQPSQSRPWNPFSNGGSSSASSSSSGVGQLGRTGSGSSFSSLGSGFNKPVSTGLGSSSFGSTGSSPNLNVNKPATSGRNTQTFGSSSGSIGSSQVSGSGLNKPGSTGLGSSSYGSTGSSPNLSSGGIASNKPTSSVKSSSGVGSTGSASKSGSISSGYSWLGLGIGNSNTEQNKPGSGTPKGTSSGSSNSGTGSLFGTGKTVLGSRPVSVAQHLQDLQRIINPPGPEEKKDLSRVLG